MYMNTHSHTHTHTHTSAHTPGWTHAHAWMIYERPVQALKKLKLNLQAPTTPVPPPHTTHRRPVAEITGRNYEKNGLWQKFLAETNKKRCTTAGFSTWCSHWHSVSPFEVMSLPLDPPPPPPMQAPFEVMSFQYNPLNPDMVAGGMFNGQVVLWDTSTEHERIARIKEMSNKEDVNEEAAIPGVN